MVRYPVAEKIVIQGHIFGVSTSFVVFSLLLPSLAFFLFIHLNSSELSPTTLGGSTGFPLPKELGYFL